jgi:hypothetical protein
MKETLVAKEEIVAKPCKYCKMKQKEEFFPFVSNPEPNLYYARCPNCNHYNIYEFIGTTKDGAILNWNKVMGHDTRPYDRNNNYLED